MPSATVKKPSKTATAAIVSKEAPSELLSQIASLQKTLASSSDLNPLADLIAIARQHALLSNVPDAAAAVADKGSVKDRQYSAKAVHRCIHILTRCLKALCNEDKILLDNEVDSDGFIAPGGGSGAVKRNEAEKAVAHWIRQRWNDGVEFLCALLNHDLLELRSTSLELLMELQVAASSSLSRLYAATASAMSSVGPSSSAAVAAGDEAQRQAQWSLSPWRALVVSLIAGPPSLHHKLGSGESESKRSIVIKRDESISTDVRAKFAENGMQKHDDVRFAALREISTVLRRPSPSAARNPSLRADALSLLLLLTAIPADQGDINNFLVDELSIPLASSATAIKKGKKKAAAVGAAGGLKVTEDGDSDDNGAEEVDMEGWFSDSGDEGGDSVDKRKGQDKSAVEGLGSAAKAAGSRRKRKDVSFHEGLHRIEIQKAAFSRAWSDLLLPRRVSDDENKLVGGGGGSGSGSHLVGGDLSLAATHEILVRLHAQILPHLTRPTMLHDFLVGCLDSRGATALLALNAIFTLVTRHNLDYPQFYTRLYALLDASVLHMRYRSRFLRLLDVFLSSTHLSAALVASFAKRLSRLSLRAPPAAIASVLPFVWNLLKRHPRCLGMIHKEWNDDRLNIGPAGVSDPFLATESDPLKTNAIESSLWELATFGASLASSAPRAQVGSSENVCLQNVVEKGGEQHYLYSLTSLAKIFAQPFTKERYNLDDFLDITYGTLFETETTKTLRRDDSTFSRRREPNPIVPPVVAYSLPGGYGAGATTQSILPAAYDRVDILPTLTARERAERSKRKADEQQEQEYRAERQERSRKEREAGWKEEDGQEREAREAIEDLKRQQRAKKRKVDQTGQQDLCARLFNFG